MSKLPKSCIEELENLFESVPPQELNETLIEIYHMYLIHNNGDMPNGKEKIFTNMYLLINSLRIISKTLNK